jgi:hypothetical protein
MKANERIRELEKIVASLPPAHPTHVDLLKIGGVPYKIVGQKKLHDISNDWQKIHGKWIRMAMVPLLEVVER